MSNKRINSKVLIILISLILISCNNTKKIYFNNFEITIPSSIQIEKDIESDNGVIYQNENKDIKISIYKISNQIEDDNGNKMTFNFDEMVSNIYNYNKNRGTSISYIKQEKDKVIISRHYIENPGYGFDERKYYEVYGIFNNNDVFYAVRFDCRQEIEDDNKGWMLKYINEVKFN